MPLYYAQGIDKIVAVHEDDQYVDPLVRYGFGTYVISDLDGPSPVTIPTTPPGTPGASPPAMVIGGYVFPTITTKILEESIKRETGYRIGKHVTDEEQQNMTAYASKLQQKLITGGTLTTGEQSDLNTYFAIFDWIGRPNGMQGASDAMIAAADNEWFLDSKWPPWNGSWDVFVSKF